MGFERIGFDFEIASDSHSHWESSTRFDEDSTLRTMLGLKATTLTVSLKASNLQWGTRKGEVLALRSRFSRYLSRSRGCGPSRGVWAGSHRKRSHSWTDIPLCCSDSWTKRDWAWRTQRQWSSDSLYFLSDLEGRAKGGRTVRWRKRTVLTQGRSSWSCYAWGAVRLRLKVI